MSEENMKQYRAEKKLDTWWVVEWPDNAIASFIDSKASTAEAAAREHADKMNAAYAKKNYNKCCEAISAVCNAAECLEQWADTAYKKMRCFTFEDPMPCFSVTDTITKMRKSFKQVEKAINSMPSNEDVEKAVKEHKNQ